MQKQVRLVTEQRRTATAKLARDSHAKLLNYDSGTQLEPRLKKMTAPESIREPDSQTGSDKVVSRRWIDELFLLTDWLSWKQTEKRNLEDSPSSADSSPEKYQTQPLETSQAKFSETLEKAGIQSRQSEGKTAYFVELKGKEIVLKLDSAQDAERQIKQLEDSYISKLESEYPIKIAGAGDALVKQRIIDRSGNITEGELLKTRQPKLSELIGLEEALRVSKISVVLRPEGTDPLKIAFLDELTHSHGKALAEYWRALPGTNQPAVIFFKHKHQASELATITAGTGTHEFAHRHQHNMGWTFADRGDRDDLSSKLGWMRLSDNRLALKTKDGSLYVNQSRFEEVEEDGKKIVKEKKQWLRVDKIGRSLDSAGKLVGDFKLAESLSDEQMKERAKVATASTYFDTPTENFAEGMMYYRSGGKMRFDLRQRSPELYQQVKAQDQLEIDRYYAQEKPGTKGIRLPDGNVVEDMAAARQESAAFELAAELYKEFHSNPKFKIAEQIKNMDNDMLSSPGAFIKRLESYNKRLDAIIPEYHKQREHLLAAMEAAGLSKKEYPISPSVDLGAAIKTVKSYLAAIYITQGKQEQANKLLKHICPSDVVPTLKLPAKGSQDLDAILDALIPCLE